MKPALCNSDRRGQVFCVGCPRCAQPRSFYTQRHPWQGLPTDAVRGERTLAFQLYNVCSCGNREDHIRMTEGVECRKDRDVIDETPAAYKPIDAVMAAQADVVEIVHTLRQVVCVKG